MWGNIVAIVSIFHICMFSISIVNEVVALPTAIFYFVVNNEITLHRSKHICFSCVDNVVPLLYVNTVIC